MENPKRIEEFTEQIAPWSAALTTIDCHGIDCEYCPAENKKIGCLIQALNDAVEEARDKEATA